MQNIINVKNYKQNVEKDENQELILQRLVQYSD
jgi:hypothetical protein